MWWLKTSLKILNIRVLPRSQGCKRQGVFGISSQKMWDLQKFHPILRAKPRFDTRHFRKVRRANPMADWDIHETKLRWCLWLVGIWDMYILYCYGPFFAKIMLFHYQYSPRVQCRSLYFKIIAIIKLHQKQKKHMTDIYISQKHRWHHLTIWMFPKIRGTPKSSMD